MTRTTKVACEGAIHTTHTDAYGTFTETSTDTVIDGRTDVDDEADELVRYEQIIRELTELEEVIAQAEEQTVRAEAANASNDSTGEEEWLL